MSSRLGPDGEWVERADLRLVPVALALWAGVMAGLLLSRSWTLSAVAAGVVMAAVTWWRLEDPHVRIAVAVAAVALSGGALMGAARAHAVHSGPVIELAAGEATATAELVITSDPVVHSPPIGGSYVVARARVEHIFGRGISATVRSPVLLIADPDWVDLLPGQRVQARGRLAPPEKGPEKGDVAAIFRPRGGPTVTGPPGTATRLTEPLRQGLRDAVEDLPPGPRGLVPGLVVGDVSMLPESLREDMLVTGLSHLTAVSGTNVTIVLGSVLVIVRWLGGRTYVLPVVGLAVIVGFVLLARPDPSVLRAAVMGGIAVVGLTAAGHRRAVPTLAAAVVALLLADPWLAISAGFTLSVLATVGIILLASDWAEALQWLPRPLALAVAVPLAAQVACAPVVVALAGHASLASLPANMLVAPAVPPATVLGAAAAAVSPVAPPLAAVLGWSAGQAAGWIVVVAERGAALPGAVLPWPEAPAGPVLAAGLSLVAVAILPALLRRPTVCLAACLTAGVMLLWRPTPGWPPDGWLIVACDVGQGDALVLRAGPSSGVVVDAGADPEPVDRCLDNIEVSHVPLLILTHFDTDHVAGVPGVLDGRKVDAALVSPSAGRGGEAEQVGRWLEAAGVPVHEARAGERLSVGDDLDMRIMWPTSGAVGTDADGNNGSIVLQATVGEVRALLTGDIEPEAQRALLEAEPGLRADVLKVPHHGSAHQEPRLLTAIEARLALVSAGADNTYGHPAPETIELLKGSGQQVYRTDVDGTIAVAGNGTEGLAVMLEPLVAQRP